MMKSVFRGKIAPLLTLLLTMALLVSACGSSGAPSSSSPSGSAPQGSAPQSSAPSGTPAADANTPRKGGRLIIGKTADPDFYDPHRVTSIHAAYVIAQLFEGLVALDFDLKTIKPALAKEWSSSPDGLTHTFKLRDDVVFHSGRKFTSADVKWNFERILNPDTASPHKVRLGQVASLETPDDHTFVLKLAAPHSELLLQLATPFMMIVDRESVEKAGDKFGVTQAAGTGPFTWGEWVPNDHMLLKRFDQYTWGPEWTQNAGPAHLDEIYYRVIPEAQTLLFELEAGNLHTVYGIPARDIPGLQKNDRIQLLETDPYFHIQFVGLKTSRPLMQDVRVRQAVNHAIDKAEIVAAVQLGLGSPAQNVVAPGTQDHAPEVDKIWPSFDPEKAKALLEEAGWKPGSDGIRTKDGQRLQLVYFTAQGNEELATIIQANLRQVGIDMQIQQMDLTVFFAALRADDYDMFTLDYAYPSVLELVNNYFSSGNIPSPNRMAWNDARTDELLEIGRSAPNAQIRAEAAAELQQILAENALWVPLFHRKQIVPINKEVQNLRPHGIYGQQFHSMVGVWLNAK